LGFSEGIIGQLLNAVGTNFPDEVFSQLAGDGEFVNPNPVAAIVALNPILADPFAIGRNRGKAGWELGVLFKLIDGLGSHLPVHLPDNLRDPAQAIGGDIDAFGRGLCAGRYFAGVEIIA
jgi:hypothetical protein